MDPYYLNTDINLICVTASSFPEGITAAFDNLHSLIQSKEPRRIFGISYGNGNNGIIYKAALEEKSQEEAEEFGCERFTVKKGEYTSIYITDFMKDIRSIGRAFHELLTDKRIDEKGYCLEMYLNNNKDVLCLVKLDPEKS
jgi:predicted transcriptional regulator YdeE